MTNAPRASARRTSAQPDWILDKSTLDLCMQRWHALIVEGNLATDKDIEDDAKTPYIDLRASINLCIQ